jgi:hypothetical protein
MVGVVGPHLLAFAKNSEPLVLSAAWTLSAFPPQSASLQTTNISVRMHMAYVPMYPCTLPQVAEPDRTEIRPKVAHTDYNLNLLVEYALFATSSIELAAEIFQCKDVDGHSEWCAIVVVVCQAGATSISRSSEAAEIRWFGIGLSEGEIVRGAGGEEGEECKECGGQHDGTSVFVGEIVKKKGKRAKNMLMGYC